MSTICLKNAKIAVVGLGYVGLPLASELGKIREVVGFDTDQQRIKELQSGFDRTLELTTYELQTAQHLSFSNQSCDIADCDVYIVTVPTPIDISKRPDISLLISASKIIGKILSVGNVVIYESTVFPGCTEEECVPILEKFSKLTFNSHFYCGYSPERINPGDKKHRITSVKKVTSGSTPDVAEEIDKLYNEIISVGTYRAESIKIAEAAKVIENTQRDLNIALVNELAIIFNKMGIDTESVLNAAGSKWNFLPFRPGLVGGHCIGVDPYYLTYKSEFFGYQPRVILAGRHLNDGMGEYIATQLIKALLKNDVDMKRAKVLILGLAFKENCPDLRNSRVVDVYRELRDYGLHVDVFDPWINADEAQTEYEIEIITEPPKEFYNAVIAAVAHDCFRELGTQGVRELCAENAIIYDLKYILPIAESDLRL